MTPSILSQRKSHEPLPDLDWRIDSYPRGWSVASPNRALAHHREVNVKHPLTDSCWIELQPVLALRVRPEPSTEPGVAGQTLDGRRARSGIALGHDHPGPAGFDDGRA